MLSIQQVLSVSIDDEQNMKPIATMFEQ